MERARKVREKAAELVEEGSRPSAIRVAEELEFTEDDVHRCLNFLEKSGDVETYTRKVLGTRHRLIAVKRN